MPMPNILLADDDKDFLEILQEVLEVAGYSIIPAANVDEARGILKKGEVSLAILDLRLVNNEDDFDMSGLRLAKEVAPSIPKIILTSFPAVNSVRDALAPMINGLPAAIDFIKKDPDHKPLLQAIKRGLEMKRADARRDIFIAHGQDDSRHEVARFIESVGLNPIILVEQPGNGLTIIEQIEHYSDVRFVVVLLTPDDYGYKKDRPRDKKLRARQNVIFELGFFIGKVGRSKVCSLLREYVEIPSDYHGVIYINLDPDGGWKLKLAANIEKAGLPIDLSKLASGRRPL